MLQNGLNIYIYIYTHTHTHTQGFLYNYYNFYFSDRCLLFQNKCLKNFLKFKFKKGTYPFNSQKGIKGTYSYNSQ